MELGKKLMKLVVKVKDVVALAKRFEESPSLAMREIVTEVQEGFKTALEKVMEAEITLFLGKPEQQGNKRNGYSSRTFAVKGVGSVTLSVPRDRKGQFVSSVIPPRKRYDEGLERDLALLHLAGLSTRMLSLLSKNLLGVKVSPQEVSNCLHTIIPSAKAFLERPLHDRKFKYVYIDGTNFHVRRSTVAKEPTLVVLGVDEHDCKSVLAMVQGDKESKGAWEMVFSDLKSRGLDASFVQLGIMDGLPGLANAFTEAFPRSQVGRCWVHKYRNVIPRVPKRYQSEFKTNLDAVQYADNKAAALASFHQLKERWGSLCSDAVACMDRDLDTLLVHYDFPQEHWAALRTTNPIERVNKELKRRSKSMEIMSSEGLKGLLAFTALRLEYGWRTTPITSPKLKNLPYGKQQKISTTDYIEESLLN